MVKHIIISLILLSIEYLTCFAQIGINIDNVQSIFHIDSKADTKEVDGIYTNTSDDIVITSDGNVGVGTTRPSNKLTIDADSSTSNLQLTNGAVPGSLLTAFDNDGNTFWDVNSIRLYSAICGQTSNYVTISNTASIPKLRYFTSVEYDNVKELFGNSYGWDLTNQDYTVPTTGIYRISFSLYVHDKTDSSTTPILGYIYKNGVILNELGIMYITYTGGEVKGYISGIAGLMKGDKIDFRIYTHTNNDIYIWALWGHTFFIIESL